MTRLYAVYLPENVDQIQQRPPRAIPAQFSWFAFVLTPIWAILGRGWKIPLLWIGLTLLAILANMLVPFELFWAHALIALWFGFAATDLEQRFLAARGYAQPQYCFADSTLEAETLTLGQRLNASMAPSEPAHNGPETALGRDER